MTEIKESVEGWAFFNRDLDVYRVGLFYDDPPLPKPDPSTGMVIEEEYNPVFWKYSPPGFEQVPRGPILGGQAGFFTTGARILDIGSGGGKAVKEIADEFAKQDIICFGIDQRYAQNVPEYDLPQGRYVDASWDKIPFDNDTFGRLISYESFPRYLWYDQLLREDSQRDIATFKEITRISKLGTIWRGTLPRRISGDNSLEKIMASFGWEIYITKKRFVAFLANKKSDL